MMLNSNGSPQQIAAQNTRIKHRAGSPAYGSAVLLRTWRFGRKNKTIGNAGHLL